MKSTIFIFIILLTFRSLAIAEESEQKLVIDHILCQGNIQTSCELIKKEFYQTPGEIVNEEEIQNAKIRLKLKSLFESVNIFLKKGTQKYYVDVIFDIVEKDPMFTEISATGYGSQGSSSISTNSKFTFGNRNLFGSGEVISGNISYYNYNSDENKQASGGINYLNPHLLNSKDYFFNASISHTKEVEFKDSNTSSNDFFSNVDNYTVFSAGLGRRFFNFSYISLSTFITDINWTSKENGTYNKHNDTLKNISLSYGWNTENDSYFATSGDNFSISYNKSYTSKLQDNASTYYYTSYQKNFDFGGKHSLAGLGNLSLSNQDSETTYFYNYSAGLQYNYQINPWSNDKSNFSKQAKIYYKIQPNYSSYNDNRTKSQEVGYITDSHRFGIIKLSLSHWSSL